MPQWTVTTDETKQYLSLDKGTATYRPISNTTYTAGNILQLASIDLQQYSDQKTVQLCGTAANQQLLVGVVADSWPGFNSSIGLPSTSAPNQTTVRGTQIIDAVVKGFQPILVDQSGSGATNITNGIPIIASRATAGYGQGGAATVAGLGTAGLALLPASGIASTLTAASLAQATVTYTVTTPAAGDTINAIIQSPYNTATPGVVQTITYSLLLTSTTAASVTLAAAAMVAYLNAQASFSQYWTASNIAGVITVTTNALSNPFLVTFGSGTITTGQFTIGISGAVTNSLTTTASVTGVGGTGFAAGGATFTGGTGYKGICPAIVLGEF